MAMDVVDPLRRTPGTPLTAATHVTAIRPLSTGTATSRRAPTALLLTGLVVISALVVRPVPAQPARVGTLPPGTASGSAPCARAATLSLVPSSAPPVVPPGHLSAPTRRGVLRRALLDPGFVLESAGAGVGAHLEDEPAAWPNGALGLAARVGSHTGAALLNIGVTHGLAAGTGLDVRFVPRGRGPLGSRLRHAVVETVTAQRATGTRVPNLPRMAGGYTAALAQTRWEVGAWRPGRAALSAALSLGFDLAVNVTTELLQSSDDPGRASPPETN